MTSSGAAEVDSYIAQFPTNVQDRLTRLRGVILEHLPGGWETVRYGMPAVMVGERYGLHFAGWKKHVALYPVPAFDRSARGAAGDLPLGQGRRALPALEGPALRPGRGDLRPVGRDASWLRSRTVCQGSIAT